jgi:hypothetical protein
MEIHEEPRSDDGISFADEVMFWQLSQHTFNYVSADEEGD